VDPRVVFVDKKTSAPSRFGLLQNYPNPFNPVTQIQYNLSKPGKVDLTIFDVNGKRVKQIVSEMQAAGQHAVEWSAENNLGQTVTSGIYFYRLIVRENGSRFSETKKMILVK
ncbi:MAG: T9SS type A sorting domain-containing protein, partial [Calditrichaeota bacterium]|nr:T9SS type A sorting domain-containing protein [Calditrichota bacterium]